MMLKLTLRKTGNSVGLVLPKEALDHLGAGEGDVVFLTCLAEAYFGDCWSPPCATFPAPHAGEPSAIGSGRRVPVTFLRADEWWHL